MSYLKTLASWHHSFALVRSGGEFVFRVLLGFLLRNS